MLTNLLSCTCPRLRVCVRTEGLGLGYAVNPLGQVVSADPKSLGLANSEEAAALYGPAGVPLALTLQESCPEAQQMHRLPPDLQEGIRYQGGFHVKPTQPEGVH